MDLHSAHSVAVAEKLLKQIEATKSDSDLQIATNSRGNTAGGEPAVAQAVITWAQAQHTARLKTYVTKNADGQLDALSRHFVGLCATLLCDDAVALDGTNIRTSLREAGLDRLAILQGRDPLRGSRGAQVEIICADHINRSSPETLYEGDRSRPTTLRTEQAFRDVARLLLKAMNLPATRLTFDSRLISAIGDTLYELFRNTDDHARTDVEGNYLRRSLRVIQARRHAVLPADLERFVRDSPSLLAYCRKRKPRPGRAQLQLVEFSVLDSGPGLSARWLSRPALDRNEELDAIKACFERHGTTKLLKGRGMGLPIVIAALREQNGFLRIRSGRHSLYADLEEERTLEFGVPPRLRSSLEGVDVPRASGTLFTFIIPLEEIG